MTIPFNAWWETIIDEAKEPEPLYVAWVAYQQTEGYTATRSDALIAEHVDGALWRAFESGYNSANHAPASAGAV